MYFLYILKCSDKTLYTGITVDLKRRINEHNKYGLGAKYVKSRRPASLIYAKKYRTRSSALKAECRVKKLSRKEKFNLIKNKK